jgi:hypothetical protein
VVAAVALRRPVAAATTTDEELQAAEGAPVDCVTCAR